MNNEEERIPLTFAELYRRARAAGAGAFPPFDLQRGLDDLRAWIDREVDIVEETGWDLASAAQWGPRVELRGRHDLLDELVTLARRPGDGPAVLVGVGGAGKSTLAGALAERVRGLEPTGVVGLRRRSDRVLHGLGRGGAGPARIPHRRGIDRQGGG